MYGHTFLRLNPGRDGREASGTNPMLAYTVSYAANGNESEGLGFALKGLTGLYAGIFTTTPYYRRLEEYTHLESRDIWEHDLTLTEPEIDQLLAHTWELGYTRFDYYFFDENCSYLLPSLLDVARPGLRATDAFIWRTLPVDTVRALTRVPGLVSASQYRPSNSTDMVWRARGLDAATLAQARDVGLGLPPVASLLIANDAQASPVPVAAAANATRQSARALEVAERYASYRGAVDGLGEERVQPLRMAILGERSRLPALDEDLAPRPSAPETGHGTARVDLDGGTRNGTAHWRLAMRPAYHDLTDPERG